MLLQALCIISYPLVNSNWSATVRKCPIWVKINDFFSRVTFELDGWPWKTIGHLFYDTISFVHHFNAIGKFKLELVWKRLYRVKIYDFFKPCDLEILRMTFKNNRASLLCYFKLCASFRIHWSDSPETPNFGKIWRFLEPCDLETWRMTLQNNRPPLLCYFKLWASFCSHWWIQTGLQFRNAQSGSNSTIFKPCDLEIWQMTFKNNRAPLICYFKLCAAFRSHWWIRNWSYSPETVLTFVTLTFDPDLLHGYPFCHW